MAIDLKTIREQTARWLQRPEVRIPLTIGLITRLLIVLVAFFGLRLMGEKQPNPFLYHGGKPHPVQLLDNFQRFDSYWFLNIARNRYQYYGVQDQIEDRRLHPEETNVTPFPLYPMLIWLVGQGTGDFTVAGLLISLGTFLGALLVLFRLMERETDRKLATLATLYLCLYPTAWLYNAIYSESLFLLLSALALRYAQDENPIYSGLYGMGAALTRLAGGLLAVPIFMEFIFGRGTRPRLGKLPPALLAGALVSAGWIGYFAYLYGLTGDFFVYFTAQQGWHKSFTPPWNSFWTLVSPGLLRSPVRMLELGSISLFIALFVSGLRWMRVSHAVYFGLGIVMPLSVTNLLGLPRYLMVLFPGFMVLGRWGRREWVNLTVVVGFSLLLTVLMMTWMRWEYSF